MDLSAIKKRLDTLQNPKAGKGVSLVKTLWSPSVGTQVVRILPSVYNKENPFKELFFHYGIGKNNTMISPTCFGEPDPIVEFSSKLKKSKEKEDWQLGRKLEPKMRVYAPIIVRGEEEKGVVLWGFGKQVYMELLGMTEDEDIGDFTDPIEGRDITITTQAKEETGLSYNTSKIRIKTKQTPISTDASKVKQWLTSQPEPSAQFKRFSYEEMKTELLAYLNPEEDIKENHDVVVNPDTQADSTSIGDLPWEKKPEDTKKAPAKKTEKKFVLSTEKNRNR